MCTTNVFITDEIFIGALGMSRDWIISIYMDTPSYLLIVKLQIRAVNEETHFGKRYKIKGH